MAQPESDIKTFSGSEMRFMTAFFTNMKSKPEVDWDQVAIDATLKDARCARDRFRQILAKHNCAVSSSATASPRKKKAGGEEGEGGTLSKVTKRAPRKKAVKKQEEGDGEEEGDEAAPAKAVKKRAPRKKTVTKEGDDVERNDDQEGEKVKDEIKDDDSETS